MGIVSAVRYCQDARANGYVVLCINGIIPERWFQVEAFYIWAPVNDTTNRTLHVYTSMAFPRHLFTVSIVFVFNQQYS